MNPLQMLAEIAQTVGEIVPRRQLQVGDYVRFIDDDGNECFGVLSSMPRLSPYFSEEQAGVMRCKINNFPGQPAWSDYAIATKIWNID